jgi:hypothetical protein
MFEIDIVDFGNEKKLKVKEDFTIFATPDRYEKFLMEYKDEIDKIILFALYSFANIKGFKTLYDKKKSCLI